MSNLKLFNFSATIQPGNRKKRDPPYKKVGVVPTPPHRFAVNGNLPAHFGKRFHPSGKAFPKSLRLDQREDTPEGVVSGDALMRLI